MSSAKDKDYVYFSEWATYIHLANDTLSQNHFSIGWGMGRDRLLTMAVSNTVYTVYGHQKERNPVLNGMPINNFLCSPTRKTLNEMSAALSKLNEHWTLDSLSYIFLSTESIFDTGLEMSFMLSREKGIYRRTRQTLWSAVQMLTQKLCCQTIHDCPKVVPLHYESE